MKKLQYILIAFLFLAITSCGDDDEGSNMTDYDYHAHIMSPDNSDKHVDDTMHIHVEFESHTGETVHHVNVRIYNADDNTEIYSAPSSAHVHETDGSFEFHDDFILSAANGVSAHSNWVVEAKVWGHDAEEGEESETVQFHVHQ